jgi:hypothetical protein
MREKRLSGDLDEELRNLLGDRPQPRGESTGEDGDR